MYIEENFQMNIVHKFSDPIRQAGRQAGIHYQVLIKGQIILFASLTLETLTLEQNVFQFPTESVFLSG